MHSANTLTRECSDQVFWADFGKTFHNLVMKGLPTTRPRT